MFVQQPLIKVYLQEGEVSTVFSIVVEVCNLQVAMDDLAAGVEELQGFVVIFQAGGQGQFHVRAPADCNTNDMTTTSPACTHKHAPTSPTTLQNHYVLTKQ